MSSLLTNFGIEDPSNINYWVSDLRQTLDDIDNQKVILNPVPEKWEEFVQLCTIKSGDKMLQFVPYPYQVLLCNLMEQYKNIVIIKSRQLGTTQAIISKFLHRACLNPAYTSVTFMRNQEDASGLSRRARQMLDGLKSHVKPLNDNVGHLKLKGLGEIYFKNSSNEGSRSTDSVADFLFDECAFVHNIGTIFSASAPSGALVGDSITKLIVSTPSAKSGWYWEKLTENNGNKDIEELCNAVAAGEIYRDLPGVFWWVDEIGTVKLILHWTCHPIYSQRTDYIEYRMTTDGISEERAQREYNLKFVDSSVSVFTSDIVKACAIGQFEDEVDKHAEYFFGVDTSYLGQDYTVCMILKRVKDKLSVVHIYRKKQQTSDYHIYQIGQLIDKYKPVCIGVENNGGGQLYIEQLAKNHPETAIEGIRTGGDTKPVLISTLLLKIEQEKFEYPSDCVLPDELLNFRRQGRKLEAANGKHDDTVMASAFGVCVSEKYESGWNLNAIPQLRLDNTHSQDISASNDYRLTEHDILVETQDFEKLSKSAKSLNCNLAQLDDDLIILNGCYVVQCIGNKTFIEFNLKRQGFTIHV